MRGSECINKHSQEFLSWFAVVLVRMMEGNFAVICQGKPGAHINAPHLRPRVPSGTHISQQWDRKKNEGCHGFLSRLRDEAKQTKRLELYFAARRKQVKLFGRGKSGQKAFCSQCFLAHSMNRAGEQVAG